MNITSNAWSKAISTSTASDTGTMNFIFEPARGREVSRYFCRTNPIVSTIGEECVPNDHDDVVPLYVHKPEGGLTFGILRTSSASGDTPALMRKPFKEGRNTVTFAEPEEHQPQLGNTLQSGSKTFRGEITPSGSWIMSNSSPQGEPDQSDIREQSSQSQQFSSIQFQ